MQNVFTKLVQMPLEKLPSKKEATWLYEVTKNEAMTYLRKYKKEYEIETVYELVDEDTKIDEIMDKQDYQKLIQRTK